MERMFSFTASKHSEGVSLFSIVYLSIVKKCRTKRYPFRNKIIPIQERRKMSLFFFASGLYQTLRAYERKVFR
jgi:hypothetical protein